MADKAKAKNKAKNKASKKGEEPQGELGEEELERVAGGVGALKTIASAQTDYNTSTSTRRGNVETTWKVEEGES